MTAYLICWKPASENKDYGWPEAKMVALAEKFRRTGSASENWRFHRRRDVKVGERAFLLRQGRRGHAIFGYGKVANPPRRSTNWTSIAFEKLLSPRSGLVFANEDELHSLAAPEDVWNARASGMALPDDVAAELAKLVLGRKPIPDSGKSGTKGWSRAELRASVSSYLRMQKVLRAGRSANKTEIYRDLAKRFGRTAKAYEYRMQNISYVLALQGRQWIPGLLPAKNVGAQVAVQIEAILASLEKRRPTTGLEEEVQLQRSLASGRPGKKPLGTKKPKAKSGATTIFERDLEVRKWVLGNAKGKCECCRRRAPFTSAVGFPFLEVHHLRRLADDGSDTVENAIAVCPNCHRELHHGKDSTKLSSSIYLRISRLVRE
jgi:5-methylcytosine-specific restriction enzyme A